jgi:hypothetical protein
MVLLAVSAAAPAVFDGMKAREAQSAPGEMS